MAIVRTHDIIYTQTSNPSPELLTILAECKKVADQGGSFEIEHRYLAEWRTHITLYYPDNKGGDNAE